MEITAERESVTVSLPLFVNGGQQGKRDDRVLVGQKRGVDCEGGVTHGQTEHGDRSLVREMDEGIRGNIWGVTVLSNKVKNVIREEIGDAKFCVIVDEARDHAKREQISIVLRYVDKNGYVKERFFGLVHVKDIVASTLKDGICFALSQYNLDVHNIRGHGYDGASNMRGEWNGLQALIRSLQSGKGLHQIGTLQRPGDTRWSSHLKSVSSLINMFSATCEVLLNIIDDGATSTQRAVADATYEALTSFEFVFILHLMKKVLEISDMLCQTLQQKSQDILNAMHLVSSTKSLLQKLRDEGWDDLIVKVRSFCDSINIPIPDLNVHYVARKGRNCLQQDGITLEHHYKIDIFNNVIDTQLQELNDKFSDHTMELFTLSSALDPKEMHTSFRIDDICQLVQKFYPSDFAEHEMMQLRMQFEHFDHVRQLLDFKSLETISALCQWLVKTRKSEIYPLVYRVVTLILTLPVSTATTERSFSVMNIIKNKLRNKIEDEFLSNCLLLYIEKEIVETFDVDSIISDFCDMKERRVPFC
ncbi:hypothetical protein GQ457_14G001000 [Hibiscus cannabinus]